jgi:hypothetical protein
VIHPVLLWTYDEQGRNIQGIPDFVQLASIGQFNLVPVKNDLRQFSTLLRGGEHYLILLEPILTGTLDWLPDIMEWVHSLRATGILATWASSSWLIKA